MNPLLILEDTPIAVEEIRPENCLEEIPIVFLHDSLGAISVWKAFPKKIAEAAQRPVVVYDRQGYGRSGPFTNPLRDKNYLEVQADFLIAVLNALGIPRCLLFGHSDGGSIALIAAAKYPQRIAGVITEGAHVFVEDITLQGIRDAQKAYADTDLKSRLQRHHGDKTEAVFTAWTETWLMPGFRDWNIEHFLPEIHCPVLVIQGENDEYGSDAQVEAIVTQVQGPAEKLILPHTGHTPHKEATEATLQATLHFLRNRIIR